MIDLIILSMDLYKLLIVKQLADICNLVVRQVYEL